MSTNMSQDPEKNIEALGRGEAPVLEQLAQMTIDTRAAPGSTMKPSRWSGSRPWWRRTRHRLPTS